VPFVLSTLWEIAEHELRGVGDPSLGEWREVGDKAVHLRRRLTVAEMKAGAIAAVCDVRGTPEYVQRLERMWPFLPPPMRAIPLHQFP
jgi:hypothetical protein